MLIPADTRETPRLLKIDEAAEFCRVSRPTVYRLIAQGKMPALKVGNSLRVDEDELRTWLYGDEAA